MGEKRGPGELESGVEIVVGAVLLVWGLVIGVNGLLVGALVLTLLGVLALVTGIRHRQRAVRAEKVSDAG